MATFCTKKVQLLDSGNRFILKKLESLEFRYHYPNDVSIKTKFTSLLTGT